MTAMVTSRQRLDELVEQRRVVICCGSGGVGKTTAAAVVALEGARRGRNAVVVTIDPAKRLANALGLDQLSSVATEIDRARWDPDGDAPESGRFSALMLDTKHTFDRLITRNAETPEQAERILENRFYRNVSGALGGTQEYMAMEKLHELHDEGGYETTDPPARQSHLPLADDADARIPARREHRRANVPTDSVTCHRHGSRRGRRRLLPRVRRDGGGLP
jgi:hypothetical protein